MRTGILKKIGSLIGFVIFLILMASCNNAQKKHSAVRSVTDMSGRTMVVPDTIRRVYTDRPGSLVLYAVASDMMVARSLWISEQAKPFLQKGYINLPYTDGSVEEIMKLKPDVIISCFAINKKTMNDADRLAKQTGIPVFQVEVDMNRYPETFRMLGNLLHREAQARRMETFVHAYLDTIKVRAQKIPEDKKVRVYYAEGNDGLSTDPSGSLHSQAIDFIGAKNVSHAEVYSSKGMSPVSMEQVLKWDPDVVLCWTGTKGTYKEIVNNNLWKKNRAVKNKAVYQIPYLPFGWFDRPPGTNRIIGTIWTAHLLYPKIFPYNMEKVTREYFKIFYHCDLDKKQLKEMLHPNPQKMVGPIAQEHLMPKNIHR